MYLFGSGTAIVTPSGSNPTPLNIGLVNGAIDTAPPPPTVFCPNEGTAVKSAIAAQAALDALTAYNALAGMPGGLDVSNCPGCGGGSAGELGNTSVTITCTLVTVPTVLVPGEVGMPAI